MTEQWGTPTGPTRQPSGGWPGPSVAPYPPGPLPTAGPGVHGAGVPPRDSWRPPSRVEPLPGTSYAVGYIDVPATTAGMAVGSVLVGVAGLLVWALTTCLGLLGARAGWGAWVSGAFAVLAAALGGGGLGLGLAALRQVRRVVDRRTGRGLALTGIVCGLATLALTAAAYGMVLLLQSAG